MTRFRRDSWVGRAGRIVHARRRLATEWLEHRSALAIALITTALTALIGSADLAAGSEISTSVVYVLPIAIAAWFGSRTAGIVASVVSAATWIITDLGAGVHYSHPAIAVWNTLVRLSMFLIIAHLLTSLRVRHRAAVDAADSDHLTGLASARRFHERLDEEAERCRRTLRPFTVAYSDLDNFKLVNDRHGHSVGDQALVVVAETLRRCLRRTDIVARLGGDEFAVLMIETDTEAAQAAWRHVHEELQAAMAENHWPITFSTGVVTFATPPSTVDFAIRIADKLMYEVKRHGKSETLYRSWSTDITRAVQPAAAQH